MVLIFGDSITQGMWDSQGGWAQRLIDDYFVRQMQDLNADIPLLFNLGISANTTTHLLDRFEPETKARLRPGNMAFVFAIGTNDAWINGDGSYNLSVEAYAANLNQLIAQAKKYSSRILFVGLPPVDQTRTTPVSWIDIDYTNERLQLFDQRLQQVCAKQNVAYVPVSDAFQKVQAQQNLLIDGLHPNDAGHQLMYQHIKPAPEVLIQATG